MLRRTAVLGSALLLAGCTEQVVLQDMLDAGNRDAIPGKDATPPFGGDAWCYPGWAWLDYEPRVAQLVIVLDRSAGMQTVFGGTTRTEAAESALMDAVNKYQAKVLFGFEQFPADSTDQSYGECQRYSCCAGTVIKPNWNNGPRISGPLQCGDFGSPCPSPSSETASHTALKKVRDFYKSRVPLKEENDHYVLLVTASEPYCFASSDACAEALEAANDLGELGIRVVVLSVGYQPTSGSCLLRISETGSKLPTPSGMKTLYTPSSVSGLNAAVAEIALTVAKTTCTMDSNDTPPPADATVMISVGSSGVPQVESTSQSGWSFANAEHTRLVLSGGSCDLFVYSREGRVSAGYSCSTCGGSPACPWP